MTVSKKLYVALGALVLTAVTSSGLGIWFERQLSRELDDTIDRTAVKLDLVNAVRARSWEMIAAQRGTFVFAVSHDAERLAAAVAQMENARRTLDTLLRDLKPLLVTAEGHRLLGRFASDLQQYDSISREYVRLCMEGKTDQVAPLFGRISAFNRDMDQTGTEFRALQLRLLSEAKGRAAHLEWYSAVVSVTAGMVLIVIAAAAVLVVRSIGRTLSHVSDALGRSSAQVASASSQISNSSQSLAQGANQQAASLEETSASAEQINAMARKNAETSQSAVIVFIASERKFEETGKTLERTVAAMREITSASEQIAKVNKVIDEIAFQTNILALNAAVEAARAGESGMGFAVVADEVRALAQRSAQAARDTQALIQQTIDKSAEGRVRVDEVASAVRGIIEEGKTLKQLMEEVNQSSVEQTSGIEQVAKAVSQMEQVTQHSAASAEEGASAAQELQAQSEQLRTALAELTAMVGGK